ncbi:MAG: hypothetical protein C4297_06820 [Gemmataceae bacterium]
MIDAKNSQWIKDWLDHLQRCLQQLQWARDSATVYYLTDCMLRDLEYCRRIVHVIQKRYAIAVRN